MDFYPASMENLIDKFASLPGVGRKSAQRLAFHMLSLPDGQAELPRSFCMIQTSPAPSPQLQAIH